MNTAEQTSTDLRALVQAAGSEAAGVLAMPGWLTPVRERGARDVLTMPLPVRKDEAWRYTSVGFLERQSYRAPQVAAPGILVIADIQHLLRPDSVGPRLVFVNGYHAPALSAIGTLPDGVTLTTITEAPEQLPVGLRQQVERVAEHRHVFSALNSALVSDGALIHLTAGTILDSPIEILHIAVGTDEPGICHPRHAIVVDEGARARVVERYCSIGDPVYFTNAVVDVHVAAGAGLVHERLQTESAGAQHLTELRVTLSENSFYRHVAAALGGEWSRTNLQVVFAGEGAEADLNGLMLAGDKQLNDVHLDIRHDVPRCTSREAFKGILDGRGRIVFDGRILVARDAQKTDAQLSNDNLMLSRSAEVDTKPQLEIYADDVKCSHGTTVGELDKDSLFYLRSRGIPESQAMRMLCQGFAGDVLDRLADQSLREIAQELLDKRLSTSGAALTEGENGDA